MAKCAICGRKFDLEHARRVIGASYGAGTYNDYYPDGDVCECCAIEEISADWNAGAEIADMMGSQWWDD